MEKFARFGFYPSDFWNRKRLLSCQNNAEFDRLTNKMEAFAGGLEGIISRQLEQAEERAMEDDASQS